MAVESQSGPCMIAFTTAVTYASPLATDDRGCSETSSLGTTHETAGRTPFVAAPKKLPIDWMLPSWPSCWTVVNHGSGFQIPGVFASWRTGAHVAASSSQSGSVPGKT